MPAEQGKPRFEPPPWEREAFERFQADRAKYQHDTELEEALRRVRTPDAQPTDDPEAEEATSTEASQPKPAKDAKAVVPEAKVNSMLAQLRMEEKPAPEPNMTYINAVCAVLLIAGLVIVVQSARLFADARGADAALNMLAATMSFVVFLTGLGFIAGAAMLFRKYHS